MTNRPSDHIRYVTVRVLTSQQESTVWTGTGTGFLFAETRGENHVPMLITNKHVIKGAAIIGLNFHETKDNNITPLPGSGQLIWIRSSDLTIVHHPDPSVDLVAILLLPIIDLIMRAAGWQPYIKCLDKSSFPSQETIAGMSALEEIVMIGYPNGLVDGVNNFPVARRGITSTPYSIDYQGRAEFLADIPIFGGSSGSPICIVNEGSFVRGNNVVLGHRFLLLGVLYAGHTATSDGEIVAEPAPTHLGPSVKITHMINLGLCIKSRLINDLTNEIFKFYGV